MGFTTPEVIGLALAATSAATAGYQIANAPKAPQVPAAPQDAKTPMASDIRNQIAKQGQGGGQGGVSQTFLAGTQGVDPSLLNLGRNTLLGGGSSAGSLYTPNMSTGG